MYIKSFKYHNHALEWQLERLELNQGVTLLVGASGVGKTRILQALLDLKKLAKGASLNGVEWEVEFVTTPDLHYKWKGAFENGDFLSDFLLNFVAGEVEEENRYSQIVYERFYDNDRLIIERDQEGIKFNGVKTVKLAPYQSVLHLLREEEILSGVYDNLLKINLGGANDVEASSIPFVKNFETVMAEKYASLKEIQESPFETELKLYLTYLSVKPVFEQIKERFVEIFPSVEDLRIGPFTPELLTRLPPFFREIPVIQIKERGVRPCIPKGQVSSGMYRSLMYLCDLYLSANGSVFLMDEFENSLGVNCIGEVTKDLTIYQRDIQLVMTSHHPYIINNIPYDNWKMVTRKGGIVRARNATEFNLGKSKHQAFTQLVNLDEYVEGVEG